MILQLIVVQWKGDHMIGYIISFVIGMVTGVFIMALCAITKRN